MNNNKASCVFFIFLFFNTHSTMSVDPFQRVPVTIEDGVFRPLPPTASASERAVYKIITDEMLPKLWRWEKVDYESYIFPGDEHFAETRKLADVQEDYVERFVKGDNTTLATATTATTFPSAEDLRQSSLNPAKPNKQRRLNSEQRASIRTTGMFDVQSVADAAYRYHFVLTFMNGTRPINATFRKRAKTAGHWLAGAAKRFVSGRDIFSLKCILKAFVSFFLIVLNALLGLPEVWLEYDNGNNNKSGNKKEETFHVSRWRHDEYDQWDSTTFPHNKSFVGWQLASVIIRMAFWTNNFAQFVLARMCWPSFRALLPTKTATHRSIYARLSQNFHDHVVRRWQKQKESSTGGMFGKTFSTALVFVWCGCCAVGCFIFFVIDLVVHLLSGVVTLAIGLTSPVWGITLSLLHFVAFNLLTVQMTDVTPYTLGVVPAVVWWLLVRVVLALVVLIVWTLMQVLLVVLIYVPYVVFAFLLRHIYECVVFYAIVWPLARVPSTSTVMALLATYLPKDDGYFISSQTKIVYTAEHAVFHLWCRQFVKTLR
jgi:hypothetical protein